MKDRVRVNVGRVVVVRDVVNGEIVFGVIVRVFDVRARKRNRDRRGRLEIRRRTEKGVALDES